MNNDTLFSFPLITNSRWWLSPLSLPRHHCLIVVDSSTLPPYLGVRVVVSLQTSMKSRCDGKTWESHPILPAGLPHVTLLRYTKPNRVWAVSTAFHLLHYNYMPVQTLARPLFSCVCRCKLCYSVGITPLGAMSFTLDDLRICKHRLDNLHSCKDLLS